MLFRQYMNSNDNSLKKQINLAIHFRMLCRTSAILRYSWEIPITSHVTSLGADSKPGGTRLAMDIRFS
jgi:hypothetical protein